MMVQVKLQGAVEYLGFDTQDLKDIADLAETGIYWEEVGNFIADLTDKDYRELSNKQTAWAVKILEKLSDMRRKGKL
jgi:hypothetical protein